MNWDNLIGKSVTVRINARDNEGKIIWNKFTSITGKCRFAGYNEALGCYQVTVNNTPIFPIKEQDILGYS